MCNVLSTQVLQANTRTSLDYYTFINKYVSEFLFVFVNYIENLVNLNYEEII